VLSSWAGCSLWKRCGDATSRLLQALPASASFEWPSASPHELKGWKENQVVVRLDHHDDAGTVGLSTLKLEVTHD